MTIGNRIRTLRKNRKLTQEQLAEYLDISSQAVSKWETGMSAPDVDTLPKLALFFETTIDDLFDFDRKKTEEEVDALIRESLPLRSDPAEAEAFYRRALEKYPNNEVLLNCLLMCIPNDRSEEKIRIGEQLLDASGDEEIRCDVLRLLALTCHNCGEDRMAKHYLDRIPELYFLKSEIASAICKDEAQKKEILKTEKTCFGILTAMLKMRRENGELAKSLFELIRRYPEHQETAEHLEKVWDDGTILDFYS